ncbi:MAG: ribosome-associated heat shock protein Hsp15 [Succinatimonas sp.]|nr:ribosome-associated heat shock protein Hsp15 [Succinatimonas sp.]
MSEKEKSVRLDKWLWAARFYKTRNIARTMIEGGKVDYNGVRAKPSRTVEIGAKVKLLQGNVRKEVEILSISDIRGSASVAQLLYKETEESIVQRTKIQEQMKLSALLAPHPDNRPNKKERRELLELKYGRN